MSVPRLPVSGGSYDFTSFDWPITDATAEEVLGRPVVVPDNHPATAEFSDRTIMVTGAGGSIGSIVCRRLLGCRPRRIVLFDQSEFALYRIDRDLSGLSDNRGTVCVPELGNIQDPWRVQRAIEAHQVDTVIHTAAYKHVSLVEANPAEAIRNNVLGTRAVLDAAVSAGVKRFIHVSTDKAVAPVGVMGATKLWAEQVAAGMAMQARELTLSIVRFGNVLGSSGSVVPLFVDQIARGGPMTVTDLRAERYFMSPTEAADLVISAGSLPSVGNIFIRDCGGQVRIHDLATRMMRMAGQVPVTDGVPGGIRIVETGLGPGEKLCEAEFCSQGASRTALPGIYMLPTPGIAQDQLAAALAKLERAMSLEDTGQIRRILFNQERHPVTGN